MKVVSTEALTRALGLIKTELGKKEPNITKKTGFNLNKTDTVQNNPSVLFTTKGAFDLKTELVNSINAKMDKSGGTFTGNVGVPTGFKVGEVDVIGTSDSVTRFGDSSRELNLNCSSGIINVLNNGRVYHQGFKPTLTDIGIPNVKNVSLNWSLGSAAPTHIWGSQGDANQSYVYSGSQLKTFIGLSNVDNWGASSAIGANSTTEYATTNMVAQVRNEKLNNRNRDNWNDGSVIGAVVGQLAWRRHNNGHTIFDASAGTTPTGVAKSDTNPDFEWSPGYPTIMGYNGIHTCGVRVDQSRSAEQLIGFDPNTKVNVNGHMLGGELARNISDTWLAARDRAITRLDSGDSSAASAFRARGSSVTFTCGVLSNSNIGFRGYYNSRTSNGCDGEFYMDVNGNCNATGTLNASAVYNAVWNDYAEYFPRYNGCITEAGDIIALNLDEEGEFYELATENHIIIVGAHSDQFGHLIGGENPPEEYQGTFTEYNNPKYIPVGLVGRLPVKFIGIAKKGMKVVPSHIPGVGRAFDRTKDDYDKVIGYIVENNSEDGMRRVKIKIGK